jgi:hypothetical protein
MPELAEKLSCCHKKMETITLGMTPSQGESTEQGKERMDELFQRYSMEREREIHQSTLQPSPMQAMASDPGDAMDSGALAFEPPMENPDDLGENVELF